MPSLGWPKTLHASRSSVATKSTQKKKPRTFLGKGPPLGGAHRAKNKTARGCPPLPRLSRGWRKAEGANSRAKPKPPSTHARTRAPLRLSRNRPDLILYRALGSLDLLNCASAAAPLHPPPPPPRTLNPERPSRIPRRRSSNRRTPR